ncbi:MAG: hypothetical protein WBP93_23455 [Pyrinomonadaceae bacterium]
MPAVEAIAFDESGVSLAIEHTLLQPFFGEKEDTLRFLTAIGSLEKDSSLRLPEYMVEIYFQVGSIPKGVDWLAINPNLRDWLHDNISAFPVGRSYHIIPTLSFELPVAVVKTEFPSDEGKIFFGRYEPPLTLSEVVRIAMTKKLPKLVGTAADKRILLFEEEGFLHAHYKTHETIKSVGKDFQELSKVDEIWIVNSTSWASNNYLNFYRIYPDLAFERDFKEGMAAQA